MFHGVITALVTPFRDGKIDDNAFREHLNRQIESGVDAVVVAGSTGEAATLSFDEHKALIKSAIEEASGRIPVIAGTGSNCTRESIELSQAARHLGADAALLISPYYNKPTQEGIYLHYKAIADAVHLPLITYSVPGRTASDVLPSTLGRLAKISNIVGHKDATGDMAVLTAILNETAGNIELYSGDDGTLMPFMALGGSGVISVLSNILPQHLKDVIAHIEREDLKKARICHQQLAKINEAMFIRSNPIPVKAACALLGWMQDELRLPLTSLDDEARVFLKKEMTSLGCFSI
ncbi:MAG: 4-hydroxy-tetrahydrodipicolinate synthase [Mariprofundaceae bacterium]|nr:4-hydroxy-tetrahydrodipicolinate synthase [Mariprofundaceae bacterium]